MKPPIFITGMPRSGTTWLGKIFLSSGEFNEKSEPFNPVVKNWHYKVTGWYDYIENRSASLERALGLRTDLKWFWTEINYNSANGLRYALGNVKLMLFSKRILLKDPIGFFNADFFYRNYEMLPVIIIKHPASIVCSAQRVGWKFRMSHLVENKKLMQGLESLGLDLDRWKTNYQKYDSDVEEICEIWNFFIHIIEMWAEVYKNWGFIKLEDLIMDPINMTENLFLKTGLEFTDRTLAYLNETMNNNVVISENDRRAHIRNRNSKFDINSWKNRLSSSEIDAIRKTTFDFGKNLYPEFYQV
ncbi:sulfotransferase [Mangrovimonas sp. DI 80]|uniref:sulfotransferase n=1 Tax=Mangrovimonas sp. DI 80 TaxID=1779330 RepID=UPI000977B2F0|nr:sulfotransferase [Mangrovimonas sp. DI 80]OMP31794.1 hypothetical protein BKM32_01660 [Mangrovimonas sp. DI 80]